MFLTAFKYYVPLSPSVLGSVKATVKKYGKGEAPCS